MSEETIKQIKADYLNIADFSANTLGNLAKKYNISLEQLLNVIDL